MPLPFLQKTVKFSDLNTTIVGNTATSQLSVSRITGNNTTSYNLGIYPANPTHSVSLSDFTSTFTGDQFGTGIISTTDWGNMLVSAAGLGTDLDCSDDGNTIISAIPYGDGTGVAMVYSWNGSSWVKQAKLGTETIPEQATIPYSSSVFNCRISGDGNVAVVVESGYGSTYNFLYRIYTRSNSVWTLKQVVNGALEMNVQGTSGFDLDPTGSTIVFGNAWNSANGVAYIYTRSGDTWTKGTMLSPTGNGSSAQFGYAVKMSGDGNTLFVVAPNDNFPLSAVYVYVKSGSSWVQQGSKIVPSSQISIYIDTSYDGNSFAVRTNSTTVVVYNRVGSTWTQQATISAPATSRYNFGYPIAMSQDGNTLALGDSSSSLPSANSGAVYIYTKTSNVWNNVGYITDSSIRAYQYSFTNYMSRSTFTIDTPCIADTLKFLSNTSILTGSQGDNCLVGSISQYNGISGNSIWNKANKISPSKGDTSGTQQMGYGTSISPDGSTMVIGAPAMIDQTLSTPTFDLALGGAYVYTKIDNTWVYQTTIQPTGFTTAPSTVGYLEILPNGKGYLRGDLFGISTSISSNGDVIVVGSPEDNSANGSVYVFMRTGNTWVQQQRLTETIGTMVVANYGASVALSMDGNTLAVGAPGVASNYNAANGVVYIYTRSGNTFTRQAGPLTGAGLVGIPYSSQPMLGNSLSLTPNGNMLAVGAVGDNSGNGAVLIYTRNGTSWSQSSSKITIQSSEGLSFGYEVNLTANGNMLFVTYMNTYANNGTAMLSTFANNAGVWTRTSKYDTGVYFTPPFIAAPSYISKPSFDGNSFYFYDAANNSVYFAQRSTPVSSWTTYGAIRVNSVTKWPGSWSAQGSGQTTPSFKKIVADPKMKQVVICDNNYLYNQGAVWTFK